MMEQTVFYSPTVSSNKPINFQSIRSLSRSKTKTRRVFLHNGTWTSAKYTVLFAVLFTTVLCGTVQKTNGQRQRPINYPPLITRHPDPEISFKIGDRIELHCDASGDRQFFWQLQNKNGRQIIETGDVGTLVIKISQDSSSGVYQCFAKNSYGTSVSRQSIVRKAELMSFPTLKEPAVVRPVVGQPLTIKCVPPFCYPAGVVYWGETTPTSKLRPIDTTDRISLDYDGNLHFANVVAGDNRDGVRYVCTVTNSILRSTMQGGDHVIEPTSSSSDELPNFNSPKLMWSSETKRIALKGHSLKMKCIFSGFPTPVVRWRRTDRSDFSRFVTTPESYGQEMEIEEVETGDSGTYQCFARNSETQSEATQDFVVTVQSEPYWRNEKPLESVLVAEGGNARFECYADGYPKPTIDWSVNGRPIGELRPDSRRIVTTNVVTFLNVTQDDVLVIQCNASNNYGYIFTNAYLAVIADPPTIVNKPEKMQKIAENQNAQFGCGAEGSPRPVIVWSKDGLNIEPVYDHIDILPNGYLKIMNASLNDAGIYKCTATNKFGFDEMSGRLIVRERTVILRPPASQTTVARLTVTLQCSVKTDEEEFDRLNVTWFRDGRAIVVDSDSSSSGDRFYVDRFDKSLTIRESSVADTATYACEASNGLDSDRASANLIVKDRPDPPLSLHLTSCNYVPTTTLTWQPGNDNNDPITDYVVYYNTSLNESESFNATDVNMRTLVVDLKPWRTYSFFVIARNSVGDSDLSGSQVHEKCVTPPSTPLRNPSGVCSEMRGSTQLVIIWEPLTTDELNGDGFHYLVSYKRLDVEDSDAETQIVTDPNRKELQIYDREVFKPYEVYVQALNIVGPSTAELKRKYIYSSEGTPAISPQNFHINNETLNCSSVEFVWNPIDENSVLIKGFFKGYQVQFWKTGEEDTMKTVDVILRVDRDLCPSVKNSRHRRRDADADADASGGSISVVTNDLWPFSKITAGVVVLNGARPGILGSTIGFDSPEGVPDAVDGLRVTEVGSFHMKIRWNLPPKPNGIVTGYVIEYHTYPRDENIDHEMRVSNPLELKAKLLKLKHDSTYVIGVTAMTSVGRGEMTYITAMTLESAAPDKPFISDFEIGDNSVNISWSTFKDQQFNPGSEYYVEYRKAAENKWEKANPACEEENWVNITNLNSGLRYIFAVVAANEKFKTKSDEVNVAVGDVVESVPASYDVASSGWFIAIMIIIALILLALIIVIFACCRQRGDKYPVWKKEKESGKSNPDEEKGFGEYVRTPESNHIKRRPSLAGNVSEEESDSVSDDDGNFGEYDDDDPDTSKFNEDGSFIGKYGKKDKNHRNGKVVPVSL